MRSHWGMRELLWTCFFDWRYFFRDRQDRIIEETAIRWLRRYPHFDPTPRDPDEPVIPWYQPGKRIRNTIIRIHALFHIWDAELDAQLRADLGEAYEDSSHLDPNSSDSPWQPLQPAQPVPRRAW